MIPITDIGGHEMYINCDLIERIVTAHDTHIVLMTGTTIMCQDKPMEIVDRIVEFRRRCGETSHTPPIPETPPPDPYPELSSGEWVGPHP